MILKPILDYCARDIRDIKNVFLTSNFIGGFLFLFPSFLQKFLTPKGVFSYNFFIPDCLGKEL